MRFFRGFSPFLLVKACGPEVPPPLLRGPAELRREPASDSRLRSARGRQGRAGDGSLAQALRAEGFKCDLVTHLERALFLRGPAEMRRERRERSPAAPRARAPGRAGDGSLALRAEGSNATSHLQRALGLAFMFECLHLAAWLRVLVDGGSRRWFSTASSPHPAAAAAAPHPNT